jgi:hypothetical protein
MANTLRNFKLDNDLFHQFEFVAFVNKRTVTAEITEGMKRTVAEFKKANPTLVTAGFLPMTEERKLKQAEKI